MVSNPAMIKTVHRRRLPRFHATPPKTRGPYVAALFALAMWAAFACTAKQATAAIGAPATQPAVVLPRIPNRHFNIKKYGARGNGTTVNTVAIQKAINACVHSGGGTVVVPRGTFMTGPLVLGSRLNLHIKRGGVLKMVGTFKTYWPQPGVKVLLHSGYNNCIAANHCHDIALTGHGAIDGNGAHWWRVYHKTDGKMPNLPHRPFMVVLNRCTRVLVKNLSLRNSPCFHLVPNACREVTIEGVHITAPANAANTDGLDPSGWHYLIKNCVFNEGDDCIAIKPSIGTPRHPSCHDFLIEHCTFLHGHGMSIGGQTAGCLRDLIVRDCTFNGTHAGIRMKAGRGYGGLVEDLTYENLRMKHVVWPIKIDSYYPKKPRRPQDEARAPVTRLTPIWRNILIRNVTAVDARHAGSILGLPEMPVKTLTMQNVHIIAKQGMIIVDAKGVRLVHCRLGVSRGPALELHHAQVAAH